MDAKLNAIRRVLWNDDDHYISEEAQIIVDWVCSGTEIWNTKLTLTFTDDEMTFEKAEQRVQHYFSDLDKHVYGNAARRYNKRVNRFVVYEGGTKKERLHVHAALERPEKMGKEAFYDLLHRLWQKQQGANVRTDIGFAYNIGWVKYIAKKMTGTNSFRVDGNNTWITSISNTKQKAA